MTVLLAGSGEGRVSRRGGGKKRTDEMFGGVVVGGKGNDRGAGVGNVIKLEFT